MEARIADDHLGFLRPKMDGKFFLLGDSRGARFMDDDLHEGDLFQGHLAAMADQVREQVLKGLDAWGEILLTGPIHLAPIWTSPLTHPGRTPQKIFDGHERHAFVYVTRQAHGDQQPSSALIPAQMPTRGQAIGELLGRLLGDGLTTARAQAILAAVPAQEGVTEGTVR